MSRNSRERSPRPSEREVVGSAVGGVRPKLEALTLEHQAGLQNLLRQGEFGKLYDYQMARTPWY